MAEEEAPPTEEPAAPEPTFTSSIALLKVEVAGRAMRMRRRPSCWAGISVEKLYGNPNRQLHSAAAADVAQEAEQAIDVHPRILLWY